MSNDLNQISRIPSCVSLDEGGSLRAWIADLNQKANERLGTSDDSFSEADFNYARTQAWGTALNRFADFAAFRARMTAFIEQERSSDACQKAASPPSRPRLAHPGAEEPPLVLDNLRTQRHSDRPWHVRGEVLSAVVRAADLPSDCCFGSWRLTVELSGPSAPWRLDDVRVTPSPVTVNWSSDDLVRPGTRTVTVTVTAPRRSKVSLSQLRQYVTLNLRFTAGGKPHTARLDVDHFFLAGDIIALGDAKGLATLAAKYMHDPFIDSIARQLTDTPVADVDTEVRRLRDLIGFDQKASIRDDPFSPELSVRFDSEAYALSPTETVRLGGDCEDWTILTGAFLARRGFQTFIADMYDHSWTLVRTSSSVFPIVVDLVAPGDWERKPMSIAPVLPKTP